MGFWYQLKQEKHKFQNWNHPNSFNYIILEVVRTKQTACNIKFSNILLYQMKFLSTRINSCLKYIIPYNLIKNTLCTVITLKVIFQCFRLSYNFSLNGFFRGLGYYIHELSNTLSKKTCLLFLACWQGKEIVGREGEIGTELVQEKQFSVPVHSNGKQNWQITKL